MAGDIIGNADAIGTQFTRCDDGAADYTADAETVAWWQDYLAKHEADTDAADEAMADIREHRGEEAYEEAMREYTARLANVADDYEQHHDASVRALAAVVTGNDDYYGEVKHDDGTTVWIDQNPYPDGPHSDPIYRASGIDAEGCEYTIIWDVDNIEEFNEGDGGGVDDWGSPTSVERI